MVFTSARDPSWANQEKTRIDLLVSFQGIGEVPFTASQFDAESHGRLLWENAVAGEYGVIAPFSPPPAAIPAVVSRFQALAALYQAGYLDDIQAYMADPGTDFIVKLAWEEAQEFRRDSPLVSSMGATLGLADGQLDDLFRFASTIKA